MDWTEAEIKQTVQGYNDYFEFAFRNVAMHQAAVRMGLDKKFTLAKRRSKWRANEAVWDEAANYSSRSAFQRGAPGAYMAAKTRGFLDDIFPGTAQQSWSNDLRVLFEATKYPNRAAFAIGRPGAYRAALRRGLLDMMVFDEKITNNP